MRAHRLQRGLSQEAMADHIGVHRTYMGGLERGERNLTLRSLERLAELLEVDTLSLLDPISAGPDPGPRVREQTREQHRAVRSPGRNPARPS